MREAINFGDVEFPIFFNYFCKKAFFNPDQKGTPAVIPRTLSGAVIIIGDAKTIERVKVVFRESIFGPAKEHLYIDEVPVSHRTEVVSLMSQGNRDCQEDSGLQGQLYEGSVVSCREGASHSS